MFSAPSPSKLFFFLLCVSSFFQSICASTRRQPNVDLPKRQLELGPVLDFQVYPPVAVPPTQGQDDNGCVVEQTLMVHSFAQSYGAPFVGKGELNDLHHIPD